MSDIWENPYICNSEKDIPGDIYDRLISGKTPVLVLRNFIEDAVIQSVCRDLQQNSQNVDTAKYWNTSLSTIGPYLARYVDDPVKYFELSRDTKNTFPESIRALQKQVYGIVAKTCSVERVSAAKDTSMGEYSPCIVRLHTTGNAIPLHNDHIVRDLQSAGVSLSLSNLTTQLSCITCIQECVSGGNLIHYNKQWKASDEIYKIANGGMGYAHEVVEGVDICRFKPQAGDVYIMNPRFYHEIDEVRGTDRVSMGFFFGKFKNDDSQIVSWS